MSTTPVQRQAEGRSIVFLCQNCHGDLLPFSNDLVERKLWYCTSCGQHWLYGDRGWMQVL